VVEDLIIRRGENRLALGFEWSIGGGELALNDHRHKKKRPHHQRPVAFLSDNTTTQSSLE